MDTNNRLSGDTTHEADHAHMATLRRLGIEGRAKIAFELSDGLRLTLESGIRLRHPDYSDEQVRLAGMRLTVGDELFKQAYPNIDIKG